MVGSRSESILYERIALRQFIANRFLIVAEEKKFTGESRSIPGLGSQRIKPGHLEVPGGTCLHERDGALLGLHQQQIIHQQELPVAVAAGLPFRSPVAISTQARMPSSRP